MIKTSNKKAIRILVAMMILVLSLGAFAGCGSTEASAVTGTLVLKVNPEFEVSYDENGDVVSIMPMNEDAGKLMEQITDYEGKPANEVIPDLVKLIDKEGYIDKKTKGEGKNINIEVQYGSTMPSETFLQDIVTNVKVIFDDQQVTGKVVITGESNYGVSQYEVSDYGNTDYKAAKTSINKAVNSGNSYTDYANTDYDGYNSDYDAKTDYDGTNTDYNSNYGSSSSSSSSSSSKTYSNNTNYSNYNNTNYNTNYNDSNYGGSTTSTKPASNPTVAAKPASGNTNYSNYDSNSSYDSGSNYNSNYGGSSYDSDSGYDD